MFGYGKISRNMNDSIAIDIDLPRDLGDIYRDRIVQLGYDAKGLNDPAEMVRTYFSVCRRLVSLQPRKVLKAKEFQCPSNHVQGLAKIESTIRSGGNLTPYLSETIKHRDFQDQLHLHWGIHHLHLGAKMRADGFVERTNHLLFCRFDNDNAYFIDVLPHGVWTKQNLITILHENWPDSIYQFRLPGVEGDSLEDEQIQNLRAKNSNHGIGMKDGVVYAPLGGGVTFSGANTGDVYEVDYMLSWAGEMQKKVIGDFEEIEKRARERGIFFADPAKFKLCLVGDTFLAIEMHSGYRLPLPSP